MSAETEFRIGVENLYPLIRAWRAQADAAWCSADERHALLTCADELSAEIDRIVRIWSAP